MYGAVQSGGRSPKPLNVLTGTPQLKPSSDSIQNNTSSFASQVKGKKRDRGDQGSDPVKYECLSKIDDADSGQSRPEHMMKKPVYVIGAERCTWKFADFHKSLRERGVVRPFTGKENSYPPLNDTAEATGRVIQALAERAWRLQP
ncbi:hypothetical protein F0562_016017 [Nyssa sinensis]|uniref:Uncharacterized protein n=1 Tax=Nyssa sinensis TaxID=561372 RepID=A0A5J4ZIF3_9ASTE|nr:hypothetical protein F0562_016017 [Nyssa sinensis]